MIVCLHCFEARQLLQDKRGLNQESVVVRCNANSFLYDPLLKYILM